MPPPAPITIQGRLNDYNPILQEGQEIKNALSSYINVEEQMEAADVRQAIAEDFPPEVMYSKIILGGPHSVHKIVRDYLELNGNVYTPHPQRNRIIWGLVQMLYTDYGDRQNAFTALENATSGGSIVGAVTAYDQPSGNRSANNISSFSDDTKTARHIAMRFKNEGSRFDGALGNDYMEYCNNYCDAARDYKLSDSQKLEFYGHVFTGEAKRHYRKYIDGAVSTFPEANAIMLKEYNSTTRQNSRLRITKLIKEENMCCVKHAHVSQTLLA
jgi:hypothetical protein